MCICQKTDIKTQVLFFKHTHAHTLYDLGSIYKAPTFAANYSKFKRSKPYPIHCLEDV